MTQSSWEQLKQRSNYHFDPDLMHPLYDTVDRVGVIDLSSITQEELDKVVAESKEAT